MSLRLLGIWGGEGGRGVRQIVSGGWEGRGGTGHNNKQIIVSGKEWGEGGREGEGGKASELMGRVMGDQEQGYYLPISGRRRCAPLGN